MKQLTPSKASGYRPSLRICIKRPSESSTFDTFSHSDYDSHCDSHSVSKKSTWFSANKVWNRDAILPDIYVGSVNDACCVHELASREIFRCVNMGGAECEYDKHSGNALGIKYLDCPIPDIDSFKLSFDLFMPILEFINEDRNSNVLIHCYKGISRSATIVIGILMHLYELPFDNVFSRIKEHRPIINPNIGFIIGLESLFTNNTLGQFCHEGDQLACAYHVNNPKPKIGIVNSETSKQTINPFSID